jgi:endonuclease/exonuclease/phosphatase family metal-dependent hydrolase
MISCSIITKTSKAIDNVDKPELKVMTFNIRYGSADDGNNSWKYRKQILFEVIRDFNPDLMGMQEVLKFQLDELLEVMPAYSSIGVGREDGKTEANILLFSFPRIAYS